MHVATVKVKPDLQQLTLRAYVPKLVTWRLRVGTWVIVLGARIAGHGLKVELHGGDESP